MGVSSARSALACSIGDANNPALLQKIRRHGNFNAGPALRYVGNGTNMLAVGILVISLARRLIGL